ncbi:MAG: hypothetical protein AB7F59_06370 [Bdellovibrionales bacterium]
MNRFRFIYARKWHFVLLLAVLFISSLSYGRRQLPPPTSTKMNVNLDEIESSLIQSLQTVMGQCSERIWPGFNWSTLEVVVVNSKKPTQKVISLGNQKVYEIVSSELPRGAFSYYNFFQLKGKAWMSIAPDSFFGAVAPQELPKAALETLVDSIFETAVHESFHLIGQASWKKNSGTRGTEFPVKWEPRYYRYMIYKNLEQAFLHPGNLTSSLQKSAHWYSLWKKDFPSEVASTTDGYEGSAEYVNVIANALRVKGCNASEQVLREEIVSQVPKDLGRRLVQENNSFKLDDEGYPIGGMAAFILRFSYPQESWQKELSQGVTPLDILMRKVKAVAEPDEDSLIVQFQVKQESKNLEINERVSSAVELSKNSQSIGIDVPHTWYSGSYSPRGFFLERESGNLFIPMRDSMTFKSDKTSSLTSQADAVFIQMKSLNPCSRQSWSFHILPSAITNNGNTIAINDGKFKGQLSGSYKKDPLGAVWFCAED